MKNISILVLTSIELIISIIAYSIVKILLDQIATNWIELYFNINKFNLKNYITSTFYYIFNLVFQEGFKTIILFYSILLIYNILLLKKIISTKTITTIIVFIFFYLALSTIFDSNFSSSSLGLSSFINGLISITIISFLILKISKKIISIQ